MNVGGIEITSTFVQANTQLGYGILDRRGALIDRWRPDFSGTAFAADSIQLLNEAGHIRGLEVTPSRIWVQIEVPDSATYIGDNAFRLINGTAEIIGVEKFTRAGFRVLGVLPVAELSKSIPNLAAMVYRPQVFDSIGSQGDVSVRAFEAIFAFNMEGFSLITRILPVVQSPDVHATSLPREGLMFDVDIYREGELSLRDIRRFLTEAGEWLTVGLPRLSQPFLLGG